MDSNLFWCIAGIVGGGIVGFIINLIFYLIGKSKKIILYTIKTTKSISNKNKDIKYFDIKCDSVSAKKMCLSKVEVKNAGNSSIEKKDFSVTHPLSICSIDFVLKPDFEKITHIAENNNVDWSFQLPPENSNLRSGYRLFDFDYIPPKGKISFFILHTNKIFIKGTLKNGIIKKSIISK